MALRSLIAGVLLAVVAMPNASADDIPAGIERAWGSTCLVIAGTRQGSCFVEGSSVLTAAHVIRDNSEATVAFAGDVMELSVVQEDAHRDFAVLAATDETPPSLQTATADLQRGESLWVLGYPRGHKQTSTGHFLDYELLNGQRYLRTDATLAPGNSGGPIVTNDGELVGMAIAIESGGAGLAVPIEDVRSSGTLLSEVSAIHQNRSLNLLVGLTVLAALVIVALVVVGAIRRAVRRTPESAAKTIVITREELLTPPERERNA
jgi:S1-C subfamily serine protease